MKKLLSILAAVGLTATSATAVVACATTVKDGQASEIYTVKLKDGKTFADLKADMFNITMTVDGKAITSGPTATLQFGKGSSNSKANITLIFKTNNTTFSKKETVKVHVKSNSKADSVLKKSFNETHEFTVKKTLAKTVDQAVVSETQKGSENYSKSLVLAKQYGLSTDAINSDEKLSSANGFNMPDSTTAANLGITGTTGQKNGSIYQILNMVNSLIHTFSPKTAPISVDSKTINTIGTVMGYIAPMLNSNTLDGAMKAIPGALEIATQALTSGIMDQIQPIISWLGGKTFKLIQSVLGELNLQDHIASMIANAPKKDADGNDVTTNVSWFMQQAANAVEDLGNNIFSKYSTNTDNGLSKFLGQEIFTKLLNKQKISIDWKNDFDPVHLGLYSIDMIDDVATIFSSLVIEMNAYEPIQAASDKPIKDAQHLFGDGSKTNSDYFASVDAGVIAAAKDNTGTVTGITLDGKPLALSMDKTFDDIFDDITSQEKDENGVQQYGILKLTNMLFHGLGISSDGMTPLPNPLLSSISYVLVNSLKFTDYEVKTKGLTEGNAEEGSITTNMDFKLKDLFTANKTIELGTVSYSGMSLKDAKLYVNTNNGDLTDNARNGVANVLSEFLVGTPFDTDDAPSGADPLSVSLAHALGMGTGPTVMVDMSGIPTMVAGIASGALANEWTVLVPVLNNLVYDIYYTDDKPNSLKTLTQGKIDLIPANWVNDAVQHINIAGINIDLTVVRKLLSFDTIGTLLKDLFVKNAVQDSATGDDSLLEQVADNLKDSKALTKYLGYIPADQVDANIASGWTSGSCYIRQDSLIGSFISDMYMNGLDKSTDLSKVLVANTKDSDSKAIDITEMASESIMGPKVSLIAGWVNNFVQGLKGQDISGMVTPLFDDKLWTISNMTYKGSTDGKTVTEMTYDITLDPTNANAKDLDGNAITGKVTYKVSFSRDNGNGNFTYNSISKVD